MPSLELFIWILVPVCICLVMGFLLSNAAWLSKKLLILFGLILSIVNYIISPTALCSDECTKYGASLVLSIAINGTLIVAYLFVIYLIYRFRVGSDRG